jgi:hypothetical protein
MKYLVKSPIQMDGKFYPAGKKIELEPDQAATMPWAVEDLKEVNSQQSTVDRKAEEPKAKK